MDYFIPNPTNSESKPGNLAQSFLKFLIVTSVLVIMTLIILSIYNHHSYNNVFITVFVFDLAVLSLYFLKNIIYKLLNSTLFISIFITILLAVIWIVEGEKTSDIFFYLSLIVIVGLLFGWKRKILTTIEIILAGTGIIWFIVFSFYRLLQLVKII